MVADLGIPHGPSHRLGDLAPGTSQGGEGVFDLVLGGPSLVGHLPVAVTKPLTEITELGADRVPGVFPGLRIVMVRLHLLDGTYELFRAHFGIKDTVTARDGTEITATWGILRSTLALLAETGVTHLAASFDTVIESFRNDMFAGYKSSEGMPPELLAQFPDAERAIESIGVVVWRNIEFEADDSLASAAIRWVEDVDQVVIVSPDKDMSQVFLGDRIVGYNRREQKIIDEAAVVEKFGVHPESIPDYLALVGDTADGVPGLPGWGAKSASAVLARYRRLELIPHDPSQWEVTVRGAEKLADTLVTYYDDALLFRDLTTLRLDVPIAEELGDLEWHGVPRDSFEAFCEEKGLDPATIPVPRWAD
jgi:5'-3' exonuclease